METNSVLSDKSIFCHTKWLPDKSFFGHTKYLCGISSRVLFYCFSDIILAKSHLPGI